LPKAREIAVLRRHTGSNIVTLILPGFNQDGEVLRDILAPGLAGSDIICYRLPRWGFDQQALIEAVNDVRSYRHVAVYAESAGALDAAALLRAYPELIVDQLILNGGMGSWEDANAGRLLQLSRIVPGWLLPNALLRSNQRKAVANSPALDPGVDKVLVRRAEQNSIGLTGRQVIGEMRRMVQTLPIRDREFAGRVGNVVYIGAPGEHNELAESDTLVKLRRACDRWFRAVDFQGTIVLPPTWTEGHMRLHAPPEKPGLVIHELRLAINRSLA